MPAYILILILILSGTLLPQAEKENSRSSLIIKDEGEEEEYYQFTGRIIRKINFRIIEVSGPSVQDNNGRDTSWFAELTNSLHYTTRDWVVKNYLLFKEGDKLDPIELSESERLLRESEFFLDARITILPLKDTDSVDVKVTTKDRWTLILQLSLSSQKNSYAGIRDDNLLGMGHKVDGTITHDQDPTTGWGTNISYTAKNIAGLYTDASAGLELNKKSSNKRIDISRPFLSVKTNLAGGLSLGWIDSKLLFINKDSFYLIPFTNNLVDLWAGYSFPFFFGPKVFRDKTSFIVSARVNRSRFGERPFVSSDSNRIFANNVTCLLSTGLINRRFYRDHYVQRFGPTEDVSVGGMIAYTWGYEINEFSERHYSGIEGVFSRRVNGLGYVSLYAAAGGYLKSNSWEQNVYNFDILFHTKLYESNEWRWRFFAQNNYLIGTNRFDHEQVYLDTENGLRGYNRFSIHGISKALLKLEGRLITPFKPLGFAIGLNLFSDLGAAADKGEELFRSRIYQSYGAGLRVTNESISEATFDVALVFKPFTPDDKRGSFTVLFTSSLLLGSRNFNFSKPSVIKYGEN